MQELKNENAKLFLSYLVLGIKRTNTHERKKKWNKYTGTYNQKISTKTRTNEDKNEHKYIDMIGNAMEKKSKWG